MKAILEFNLPEDEDARTLATKGSSYYFTLHEIDQKLRSILKHGHSFKSVEELAEFIRNMIHEEVDMDEIS